MTIMNEYQSKSVDIAAGFITILTENGLGRWDETGTLTEADTPAIFLGPIGDSPIRALGLNLYVLTMDAEPGVDKMSMAFSIRTPEPNPVAAITLADALEDTFHGREHQLLRKWHIPIMWRHSLADLGPNDNGHYQLTDTYHFYIDIYRKAADNG